MQNDAFQMPGRKLEMVAVCFDELEHEWIQRTLISSIVGHPTRHHKQFTRRSILGADA
jgi:hypothetical protein